MRFNKAGQIATDDRGAAVCGWIDEAPPRVGPYQRDTGGDVWEMVTRAGGVVSPVPGVTGGCNQVASANGRWMRRLDSATPMLSGSDPWLPLNGFVGDMDENLGVTISADGRTLRTFSFGALVSQITRSDSFGGLRLKGSIAAWVEFPGPHVVAVDVMTKMPIPVSVVGAAQYTPVVFDHPTGKWALYQTDELGGVCHRVDDASQGYIFGVAQSIYDPDVLVSETGCTLGWSVDAGQFQTRTQVIATLGQGMVPLVITPVQPVGPTSVLDPAGQTIDLLPYYLGRPEFFPRGGTPEGGDLPGQHYFHQVIDPPRPDGTIPFYWLKFAPAQSQGRNYEAKALVPAKAGQPAMIHSLLDQSNHPKIAWPTDTRWVPQRMKTGRAHAFDTGLHEIVGGTIGVSCDEGRGDFERFMWIERYPSYYWGPDLGEHPTLLLFYDPTGGHHYSYNEAMARGLYGPDRGIECFYFPLDCGLVRWESYRSDLAMKTDPPIFDMTTIGRGSHGEPTQSNFYTLGGPPIRPVLNACIPSPSAPVEPPVPTSDRLRPGDTLKADAPLVSQDKRFRLLYQLDGNLVGYGPRGPLWDTRTHGQTVGFCAMQGDGNFVVYDKAGKPRWASNTNGNPGAWLLVQNDGNTVIYSAAGKPIWASNTVYQPLPPIPPGPMPMPDMHQWPKVGASYQQGLGNPSCDPALFASLNRDADGDVTRIWAINASAVGPNGAGQYTGYLPWYRIRGVYDLTQPDPAYDERLNTYVRAQNAVGATVIITTLELYSWAQRKQGGIWVPDANLGPFRNNSNRVRWGDPDDPTFFTLPDWVLEQLISRICAAVKGLAVAFEIGNEMPEKDMHTRIREYLTAQFTADWRPDIIVNRQEDTPGQYFNMRVNTDYERIAFHGKDSLGYLDEVYADEPASRPQTFRQLWDAGPWETPVNPSRVIMSSDGCRVNDTIQCYDWPVLREVVQDHLRRGFSFEHQSCVKMRPFLENRLDLVADFEGDWLRSLRG